MLDNAEMCSQDHWADDEALSRLPDLKSHQQRSGEDHEAGSGPKRLPWSAPRRAHAATNPLIVVPEARRRLTRNSSELFIEGSQGKRSPRCEKKRFPLWGSKFHGTFESLSSMPAAAFIR